MQDRNASPRHRVLLVDDDLVVLKIAKTVLGLEMDVVTCTSGRQALILLDKEDFHVVVSDYMMPDMNGDDLLQEIARTKPHIRCLLLTASQASFQSERKDYFVLHKPFNPERLLSMVSQMARVAEMKRSVSESGPRSAPPASNRPPTDSARGTDLWSQRSPDSARRAQFGPDSGPPSSRSFRFGRDGKS